MPVTVTPLRYPGGKSQLKPLLLEILRANQLVNCTYVEPYAGGAGLAMALLLERKIYTLHINDIDPAIHALWYCVLHRTEELIARMWRTPVTLEEWHKQRAVQSNKRASMIGLGFSTLFLNRTNRSGILKGGVIGGFSQNGNYLIDCRFNKEDLEKKILAIAARRHAIVLTCMDALELVRTVAAEYGQETLVNLDPPYYTRGPELYINSYDHGNHAELAQAVQRLPVPWMVTYDDCAPIRAMYRESQIETMPLRYSAQEKRRATELLISPQRLVMPRRLAAA